MYHTPGEQELQAAKAKGRYIRMSLFKKKDKTRTISREYDKENQLPVIHSSICTGEKVFGFKDRATGKFEEIACIRTDAELTELLASYGIARDEVKTEY